jgi:hypothetical protein
VPEEVRQGLKFVLVEHLDEVLETALHKKARSSTKVHQAQISNKLAVQG